MKLVSWNVNGIRAIAKKGFYDWLRNNDFDMVCLQETKALPEQLDEELLKIDNFSQIEYYGAERKGYSGVADYFRKTAQPYKLIKGFEVERVAKFANVNGFDVNKFNAEGRLIESFHKIQDIDFVLFNIYFPNGGMNEERLKFKLDFYDFFLAYLKEYKKDFPNIIITGDFNTAHHPIDLARPDENVEVSGFMPIERERLDWLEELGFVDSFRHFNKSPDNYTWWSYRTAARKRNVGWRIDYFFLSESMLPYLKSAAIHPDVEGSDHCPISIRVLAKLA